MIHGQGCDHHRIPLHSIIISYMRIVARTKTTKTYFGFLRLLIRIFESLGVNIDGEEPIHVPHTNIIMATLLKQIKMADEVITDVKIRLQGEAKK